MNSVNEFMQILPILNVLIVPALIFVVRIDRRMGQIDVLAAVSVGRIDKLEEHFERLRDKLAQIEYSTRHT